MKPTNPTNEPKPAPVSQDDHEAQALAETISEAGAMRCDESFVNIRVAG
jgi:hypothetical protein